jgi:hypothetical protein
VPTTEFTTPMLDAAADAEPAIWTAADVTD